MEQTIKPCLLVVEDDYENQKFLRIFLRRKFEVEICESADECFDILKEKKIDIILLDISLTGSKDGLQITRELRANEKFKNLPIIGLSAHAFQKDKDNAYKAGIDVFLTKPVDGRLLLESLINTFEERSGIKLA